jgi:NodT family efflux transporter outer membrane factor (OMF) lipoprotein
VNKNMKKHFKSVSMSIVLASFLGGCAVSTPYQRPDVAMPATWDAGAVKADMTATGAVSSDWWKQFGNAELDRLMDQALAANHDLAAAVSRIEQSRAAAGIVGANRYPSVGLAGNATKSRSSADGAGSNEASQLAANVAYELDLWGGNSAQREAAGARVESSVYDRDAVALVLQADVASNYFQVLALKDRLAIARKNLQAARELLSLVQARYDKGSNTGLELAQQKTSVLNIEAQIPQLEQELRATQTALAVLLGQTPQGFSTEHASLADLRIPAVAAFQPPALLERRPDIRQAEAQLVAANADIGAARAALYPRMTLSATAVAGGVLTSGSSVVTSMIASLSQTLFDGGALRSQVRQSEARRTELVAQYLQTVLASLKEVQDGLGAVASTESRQTLLRDAVVQAQEAYRIANVRYGAGSQDLLTLLDSQRTQLQAEDSLVQAELARLSATVGLYKALGGGWNSGVGAVH